MASPPPSSRRAADDYEAHFVEKLWALVPEVHRHEDGVAPIPGQLRALIEILAAQAAIERRSIDRIVADSRITEADDWAVAYIGQLLGTRLLHPLNTAGRRADVAHTLAYRRRAGTPRLLETLVADVANWDGVAHEAFQHLLRYPHALDREFPAGPVTGTPRGGFPDLRSTRVGDTLDGPFEDLARRPEFRPGRGTRGRYDIVKTNLFCYRKQAHAVADVTPYRLDATHYTIDPSGRGAVPLFQVGSLDRGACDKPAEWAVRMPITCRRLNAVSYRLPVSRGGDGPNWSALAGRTFDSHQAFLAAAAAEGAADLPGLLAAALDGQSPKARLLAHEANPAPSLSLRIDGGEPLPPHAIAGADLSRWADGVAVHADVRALVDPALGRVQLVADPADAPQLAIDRMHYGILEPVGAGTHDRRRRVPVSSAAVAFANDLSALTGDVEIGDSRTYAALTSNDRIRVTADARLWARDAQRPYVLLSPSADAALEIRADEAGASVDIDGLWIGAALSGAAIGGDLVELRLTGSFGRVRLRDVTLDPGGERAALPGEAPGVIPHLRLVLAGRIEELTIDRCILGSVHERLSGSTSPSCTASRIQVLDSLLLPRGGDPVLVLPTADLVSIERSTILGDCSVRRAEISNAIVDGVLEVQDAQASCLRFSMVRAGGRLPSPYEAVVLPEGLPPGSFESTSFGHPGLGVLTPTCPASVSRGGEDGTEMGAFNRALVPIKLADVRAKVAEFAPVQSIVQLMIQT